MSHVRQTSTLSLSPALWRFRPNESESRPLLGAIPAHCLMSLARSCGRLPRMDRILCVVRELTDDSRRGAGGTAHKINWMKEHYRGGRLLQKPQCGTVYAR